MDKLSSKHFMFFILGCSMIALRSYSSIFVRLGGRDTWILAFFASIIFIIITMYLLNICIKSQTFNIKDIFFSSSNWLGQIYMFIFAVGLFSCAVESASVEASSIHTNFFLSTPNWYCLLFLIIPAAYILTKQMNTILILVIITVTLTLVGDVALLALVSKYLDFNYLLPILGELGFANTTFSDADFGVVGALLGVLAGNFNKYIILVVFAVFILLAFIFPRNQKKEN